MRYCATPGCTTPVRRGRCPKHSPPRTPHTESKRAFYRTRRWRDGIRRVQLGRHPLCELNQQCTDPTPATHVHHRDGNVQNNQPRNLQSLCTACHTWQENQPGGALHGIPRRGP